MEDFTKNRTESGPELRTRTGHGKYFTKAGRAESRNSRAISRNSDIGNAQ